MMIGKSIDDDVCGKRPERHFRHISTELVTPQPGTDETVFSKAVEALDVYFNPKQNN